MIGLFTDISGRRRLPLPFGQESRQTKSFARRNFNGAANEGFRIDRIVVE